MKFVPRVFKKLWTNATRPLVNIFRTVRIRRHQCPYCTKGFVPARIRTKDNIWRVSLICPDKHYGFIYFVSYASSSISYSPLDNLGEPLEISSNRIKWIGKKTD